MSTIAAPMEQLSLQPTAGHPLKTAPTSQLAKAEEEAYTLIAPRKISKKATIIDEDEPLIDTTEAIPLKSKKTDRKQKQQQQKAEKAEKTKVKSDTKSFLELPTELLHEVLSYLRPSDVYRLQRVTKDTHKFLKENEESIARDIIRCRYWTLHRSLPRPVAMEKVNSNSQLSLTSKAWQDRLQIHKRSYQHVKPVDPRKVCTCMTCAIAWNDLNMVLDFAHFQGHLSAREPIPMIPRGSFPLWNENLLAQNAAIVEKAIKSPLSYALILEIHLSSIVGTLTRTVKVGKKTWHPKRLYHLSSKDVEMETDEFLERSGPPSYEFPYHRDRYYNLEAYVPNRKWDKEKQKWLYAKPGVPHENDLAWTVSKFPPDRRASIC